MNKYLSDIERENMGKNYMKLATLYGHIELQRGLKLYTIAALEAEANGHNLKSFYGNDIAYLFVCGKYIFECTDPCNVIEMMEYEQEKARAAFYIVS